MKKLKITEGHISVVCDGIRSFKVRRGLCDILSNDVDFDEQEANARLIEDTFNTYQKTGMLPSEMADNLTKCETANTDFQSENMELKQENQDLKNALKRLIKVTANYKVGVNKNPLIKEENKTYKIAEKALSGKESRKKALQDKPTVKQRRVKVDNRYFAKGYGRGINRKPVYLIDGYCYAAHREYWKTDYQQLEGELEGELEGYVRVNKSSDYFHQVYGTTTDPHKA